MDPIPGKKPPMDTLEGLDPAELLRQGAAGETLALRPDKFEPPSVEELAQVFPQLEILGLIGKGGMGAVYKVRQREIDRMAALKILPPEIGRQPGFAERFAREARALAKLNHPGIVTLYEFGQAGEFYFFVMEFVDGVMLRQILGNERISPREAMAIVPQICDALQYAHDQGIVHRDIKPENILLDRLGRVKVADFGIAKLAAAGPEMTASGPAGGDSFATYAGGVMGTPPYMAPEQFERPAAVDHRADIYALGVVFYQMLTGELPGKPTEAPSRKVLVDVRLDEVVLRALEEQPALRFQQAGEVKTQVETIASSPAGAVRGRRQLRVLGWCAAALVIGVLAWLLMREGKEEPGIAAQAAVPAAQAVARYDAPEVLRSRLAEARLELEATLARQNQGSASVAELHAAEDAVAVIEAQLEGDPVKVAQAELHGARRAAEYAEASFESGMISRLERDKAKAALVTAEAKLQALLRPGASAKSAQAATPTDLRGQIRLGKLRIYKEGVAEGERTMVTIPVQAPPGAELAKDLSVEAEFFDTAWADGEQKVLPSDDDSKVESKWLTSGEGQPLDFADGEEQLQITYLLPVSGKRRYYGQVVKLSYKGELIDLQAMPPHLIAGSRTIRSPRTGEAPLPETR